MLEEVMIGYFDRRRTTDTEPRVMEMPPQDLEAEIKKLAKRLRAVERFIVRNPQGSRVRIET